MSLNGKKEIVDSAPILKLYNTDDSEYDWTWASLQLDYDATGKPECFDRYEYFDVGQQTNTAYAQNLFYLLQTLWNNYSRLNDTTYVAENGITLDALDSYSQGMLSVNRNVREFSNYFRKVLNMEFTGVWSCNDGTAGARVYYNFRRDEYKNGKVEYALTITCKASGRTDPDEGDSKCQVQEICATASNTHGDKIEQGASSTWVGYTSNVTGRNTSLDDMTLRGHELTVYEK